MSLAAPVVAGLMAARLDPTDTERVVRTALAEDLRYGPDVTTVSTVDPDLVAVADIVSRARGVIAGIPVLFAVLDVAGLPFDEVDVVCPDGSTVTPAQCVVSLRAPLAGLLSAERTLLNLVNHLSGIATATRQWVDALAGTGCRVRDTRKTTPGLRDLEKYAVRCGGGSNHRMGLGDAALIKDNHVVAAGGVAEAIAAVRAAATDVPLEVECDTLDEVDEAIAAGVGLILLDNMTLPQLRAAVAARGHNPTVRFEASGGLRLEGVRAVAETGVDYVAVGALTHSSPVLDLGLDVRPQSSRDPMSPEE